MMVINGLKKEILIRFVKIMSNYVWVESFEFQVSGKRVIQVCVFSKIQMHIYLYAIKHCTVQCLEKSQIFMLPL